MKIDSTIQNGVGIQVGSGQGEWQVRQKGSSEAEINIRKASSEAHIDVNSDHVINDEMLDNAVEQANKSLSAYNKFIERSVHEKTHAIIYVLKDSITNEVIREFPPRKIQDMIAKMWELAGLLVDERR
ncbi:flagellar protein FlaG [Lutispora sp.]|uniref:flagellar protein FlaG n=1 Tax=Lutispora sp. TaxID=2828727 RepID=UPI00356755BB